ncbi:family 43 glycosylhydrolase [Actinokineospora sp. 24-640]
MTSEAPPEPRRRPRSRLGLAAVVASLLGGTVLALAPTASAAVVDPNAWYVLVNRNSGKALDVYNRATNDGAQIVQYARNDGAWQQWQFVDSGGGFYRLRSRHSGKVLDISGGSTADGANLVQWADSNATNQQFRLADSADGHVRLINRKSSKALDVYNFSTADGARVVQWADLNGANQQWRLVQLGAGGGYPNPGHVTGDIGVHDPAIVKRPTGGYLLAHTGNDIALKTSADRIAFRNAGSAFPGGTPWTSTYTNGGRNLWAPDLSHHNGQYHLYYSASTFGSNRSAIFLATSPSGNSGTWTNRGLVIESRTSDNFNAIDPNLVIDDQGRWWLSFGSFWSGIKMVQLDPATGRRLDGAVIGTAYSRAIEAPFIVKRGAYYYQYVSFDRCCQGAASTYRVMVGRSSSVTGPYLDRAGVNMNNGGGTEILAGHGSVHGPGHQAVLADTDGDFLVYHYYTDSGAALLGINRLVYDAAGWPSVQ